METQIEKKIKEITPVTINDYKIYKSFFLKSFKKEYKAPYSFSWAYITQAARGTGHGLGLKFYTQDCLITIGIHKGHFVIIRPLGNYKKYLSNLLKELVNVSKTPVYIKKLTPPEEEKLKESGIYFLKARENYPWSAEWPEDDDTFPEIIIEIDKVLEYEKIPNPKLKNLRSDIHRFLNLKINPKLVLYQKEMYKEVFSYLRKFFGGDKNKDASFANAYKNMLINLPYNRSNFFSYVYYIGNEIVGYFFAERINGESAGLYASTGYPEKKNGEPKYPGLTPYLHIKMMEQLKQFEIKYLNLGGSEVESLHRFKLKFQPIEKRKINLLIYPLIR